MRRVLLFIASFCVAAFVLWGVSFIHMMFAFGDIFLSIRSRIVLSLCVAAIIVWIDWRKTQTAENK